MHRAAGLFSLVVVAAVATGALAADARKGEAGHRSSKIAMAACAAQLRTFGPADY
jgi:hypothetical protein